MRVLAEKGRINWRNQDLWRALNKMQTTTSFRKNDNLLLDNPVALRSKLARAFATIYDKDEYYNLEQKNESTFNSKKKERYEIHGKTSHKLSKLLDDHLARIRNNDPNDPPDPIDYESMIEYCIEQGKSYGENAIFHLVSAMAEGILDPDRGIHIARHATDWPPSQMFENFPTSRSFYQQLCSNKFGESFRRGTIQGGGGQDFFNWFYTEALNAQNIRDRVNKATSAGKFDPDWVRQVLCMGNAEDVREFFAGKGGAVSITQPHIEAAYTGFMQYTQENAINPVKAGRDQFARVMANVVMAEGILHNTAYKSMSGDVYARRASNNKVPNEGSLGRYPGKSLGFNRSKFVDYLDLIDADLFKIFRSGDAGTKDRKEELANDFLAYIRMNPRYTALYEKFKDEKNIDNIFNELPDILNHIFMNMTPSEYKAFIDHIARDAKTPAA